MSPRTKTNLETAMQRNSFDAATYGRFAARARMDDDWELARIFQDLADCDRTQYFSKEAELDGLIACTAANLRKAIDTESNEASMFLRFAREANEDGDAGVADVFERASRDKAVQRTRLEAALAELGVHSGFQTVTA